MLPSSVQILTSTTPILDAAQRLNSLLDEYRSRDMLLLLSGGSAFSLLEHTDTTALSERDTVSVLDERYTFDDSVSNFSQLTKTAFFESARKQHVQLIDPRPSKDEDLLDTARRYDLALKYWHITHHDGIVITTMGIGADGHTAGILPFPSNKETFEKLFINTEKCVQGYHVDARVNSHQDRMTVTCNYLTRHVSHAVVFACGEEKRKSLRMLFAKDGNLHNTPARVFSGMQHVDIFTNQDVEVE